MTEMFDLQGGGNNAEAWGISANGGVTVGVSDGNITQPTKWLEDPTSRVGLGSLGSGGGSAYDASADGTVIVGYGKNATGQDEAFRWTSGGGQVGSVTCRVAVLKLCNASDDGR